MPRTGKGDRSRSSSRLIWEATTETHLESASPNLGRSDLGLLVLRSLHQPFTQPTQRDRIQAPTCPSHLSLDHLGTSHHRRNDVVVRDPVLADRVEDPLRTGFESQAGIAVAGDGVVASDLGLGGDD